MQQRGPYEAVILLYSKKLPKSYTILENVVKEKYPEILEETLRNQINKSKEDKE